MTNPSFLRLNHGSSPEEVIQLGELWSLGTEALLRWALGTTVIETTSSSLTKVNSSEGCVTQSSIPDENMGE